MTGRAKRVDVLVKSLKAAWSAAEAAGIGKSGCISTKSNNTEHGNPYQLFLTAWCVKCQVKADLLKGGMEGLKGYRSKHLMTASGRRFFGKSRSWE